MHLGRDRVIGAYEMDGMIVDPGPSSCMDTLVAGLEEEPRALLLTHIHLDHAGAAGRWSGGSRDCASTSTSPVPSTSSTRRSCSRAPRGSTGTTWTACGGTSYRCRPRASLRSWAVSRSRVSRAHAPGHARHHVVYLHEATGDAYVGDVAGVRIPPIDFTIPPTPPPDIDLEAWERSLDAVAEWDPSRLCLTHFGPVEDPHAQLERARERLRTHAERARDGDREQFMRQVAGEIDEVADERAARQRQALPQSKLWLGLERYWRKREEGET